MTGQDAVGNVLGSARAETDAVMLERAFVETEDYQALIGTQDFSFVVGRRGTGKSALFQKTRQHFAAHEGTFLLTETPREYETIELQRVIKGLASDYRSIRVLSRLTWKITILLSITDLMLKHHKAHKASDHGFLTSHRREHAALLLHTSPARCAELLKPIAAQCEFPRTVPDPITHHLRLYYQFVIEHHFSRDSLHRFNFNRGLSRLGKQMTIGHHQERL